MLANVGPRWTLHAQLSVKKQQRGNWSQAWAVTFCSPDVFTPSLSGGDLGIRSRGSVPMRELPNSRPVWVYVHVRNKQRSEVSATHLSQVSELVIMLCNTNRLQSSFLTTNNLQELQVTLHMSLYQQVHIVRTCEGQYKNWVKHHFVLINMTLTLTS